MKKITGLLALVLISTVTFAQNNALDKHFSNYQQNEDFTKVNVSGKMFQLAAFVEVEDEDIAEIKDFASGVDALKMLIGHEIGNGYSKYNDALSKVQRDYDELMSVDDKNGKFTFFINERNGIVNEFLVVGAADSMLCLISMTGHIDLKKLGNISQKIQADGFNYIGKMNENGANKIKMYPNPAVSSGNVSLDIPEELNGADLRIYNTSGQLMKSDKVLGGSMTVSLTDLKPGQYILDFVKGDTSIKKKLVIK